MKKLLYINNYNCSNKSSEVWPDNHLWGADALSKVYNVTCAKVPQDFIKFRFKGSSIINNFLRSLKMLSMYFRYDIVYSACGELTDAFALANILHIGKRRLYKIQHHGDKKIPFAQGYTKIMFISPFVSQQYVLKNKVNVNWGGQISFAEKFISTTAKYQYDFVSAGNAGRDNDCMIAAANTVKGKTLIISTVNNQCYNKAKITVLSGNESNRYSTSYNETYAIYAQARFIVVPIVRRIQKTSKCLSGLNSFVDAVVMHKPVLASDSTNMGIDIEGLGIGMIYKAGDVEDMRNKMQQLLSLSEKDYKQMCDNMKVYSKTHNYGEFCKEIIDIIEHS